MKNNYELKQTTILSMENEALREQIKELKLKIKKLDDEIRQAKGLVQSEGIDTTTEERQDYKGVSL